MRVFASEIEQDNLQLAADVKQWVYLEERKIVKESTHEAIG
jgi:hypothetical protein